MVGDFIEVASVAGTVEKNQIFATKRVTSDNKTIIVPNIKMSGDNIANYSANETRLVELVFVIGCGEDIDHACQVIDEVISQDARVLAKPAPMGIVSELADGSLNFKVPVWISADNYWGFYYDITEKVKKRFDTDGIRFPFPQRVVHMHRKNNI
jgi:small conductance mechanosensitive channel